MTTHRLTVIRHDGIALVGFFAASFAAAAVGGLASVDAGTYYNGLDRPAWAPPSGLFGPVWTVLYTLIAIAGWLVWRRGGFRAAPVAFGLQSIIDWTWFTPATALVGMLAAGWVAGIGPPIASRVSRSCSMSLT